ncbi:MAG: CopG family transcriptional regulator [bacterium]
MKTLTLKLPEILEARLNAMAEKKGVSKSEIVRHALADYFSRDVVNDSGTFLELAKDLAGLVEGPPDLSVNKAHLEDSGSIEKTKERSLQLSCPITPNAAKPRIKHGI